MSSQVTTVFSYTSFNTVILLFLTFRSLLDLEFICWKPWNRDLTFCCLRGQLARPGLFASGSGAAPPWLGLPHGELTVQAAFPSRWAAWLLAGLSQRVHQQEIGGWKERTTRVFLPLLLCPGGLSGKSLACSMLQLSPGEPTLRPAPASWPQPALSSHLGLAASPAPAGFSALRHLCNQFSTFVPSALNTPLFPWVCPDWYKEPIVLPYLFKKERKKLCPLVGNGHLYLALSSRQCGFVPAPLLTQRCCFRGPQRTTPRSGEPSVRETPGRAPLLFFFKTIPLFFPMLSSYEFWGHFDEFYEKSSLLRFWLSFLWTYINLRRMLSPQCWASPSLNVVFRIDWDFPWRSSVRLYDSQHLHPSMSHHIHSRAFPGSRGCRNVTLFCYVLVISAVRNALDFM